jgi:hypothetical protein
LLGGGEDFEGAGGDAFDGPESADAFVAAGEHAVFGADEGVAPCGEGGDVALGGGMEPHFAVHGRGVKEASAGGEGDGAEGIIGHASGEAGEDVGGRRGDENKVGAIGEVDVAGPPALLFIVEARDDRVLRQDLERERGDEFLRVGRHDGGDGATALGEEAGEVGGFVGGDGAGDAEDDVFLHRADARRYFFFLPSLFLRRLQKESMSSSFSAATRLRFSSARRWSSLA